MGEYKHKLLHTKYGVTSYAVFESEASTGPKKICVLSHGLGGHMGHWEPYDYPKKFNDLGYTVIMFSFYGHGWSWAGEDVMLPSRQRPGFNEEVSGDQVKTLLTHVLPNREPVDLWVGHSTGGLLGALVAETGIWRINKIAFSGAALWVHKPCNTRLLEMCHPVSTGCLAGKEFARQTTVKEFSETIYNAFGKNDAGKFHFPEEYERAIAGVKDTFVWHPQVAGAIFSTAFCLLNSTVVNDVKGRYFKYAQTKDCPTTGAFFWGDKDIVVPYKEGHLELTAIKCDKARLETMVGLGHELFQEDSNRCFEAIAKFAQE